MISLKQFHYFFITVSILITGYYGVFEINHPSNPGLISNLFSGTAFLISVGLIGYGIAMVKKIKQF